jgi:type IV pilus assembly protein PilW
MQRRYFNQVMHRAAGFTLVELMVSLAISLLLLTGVVAIFSSSRFSYESTDQSSRIQETGRFALDLMSRHVRASGFSGCSRQPNYVSSVLNSATSVQWNFLAGPVLGFDAEDSTWTPELGDAVPDIDEELPGSVTAGSDVLLVRGPRLDVPPALVTTAMADASADLTVDNASNFKADGEVVMAYSCEGQSVFYARPAGNTLVHTVALGGTPGNQFDTTNFPFRENSEVVPVETVVYYVGKSSGGDSVPNDTTSLWRRAAVGNAEELVQGVERMQVRYGVDTTMDRVVDDYVDANEVTNWDNVVAVRIALLVRSVQEYGTDLDTRTYTLLDTEDPIPAANDRRQREVFTATVSIRNRVRIE